MSERAARSCREDQEEGQDQVEEEGQEEQEQTVMVSGLVDSGEQC